MDLFRLMQQAQQHQVPPQARPGASLLGTLTPQMPAQDPRYQMFGGSMYGPQIGAAGMPMSQAPITPQSPPMERAAAVPPSQTGATEATPFQMQRFSAAPAAPAGAPAQPPAAPMATPATPQYDVTRQYGWSKTTPGKEGVEQYGQAIGAMKTATSDLATAEKDLASGRAGIYAKAEKAKADAREEYAQQREAAQSKLAPEEANLLALSDAVRNGKVDPEQFWNDRSTGQKIAGVLGMIIGGFTEGFTGGKVKNTAMTVIQRAIDHDIASQKANLSNQQASLSAQRGLVSYMYGKIGDIDRAESMARVVINDGIAAQLAKVEAQHSGTIKGLQAARASAQFEAQSALQLARMTSKTSSGRVVKTPKRQGQGTDPLTYWKKRADLQRALQRAGMAKRPMSEKETNTLGQVTTAMETYGDFLTKIWDEKVKTGWAAPKTAPDLAEFAWSKIPGTKGGAIYNELFTHAMAATRELSGAQAAVIETKAQQRLQPSPIDSQAAIQYKARGFYQRKLRQLIGSRNAKAQFANVNGFDESIKRVIKRAQSVGKHMGDEQNMNAMLTSVIQGL